MFLVPALRSQTFRFCPSIFLYLASVCPSIWLIELDKLDTRLAKKESLESQEFPIEETSTTTEAIVPSSAMVTSADPNEANFSKVDLGVLKDVGVSFF